MATKLFLRNTQANAIGAEYFDMVIAAGAGTATAVVDTDASTEKQWTQASGGSLIQWISGRVPAGGFTLTTTDISIWAHESATAANAGGRYRVFKRAADGTETELGGGPFNDGVEFTKSTPTEMTWAGNVTDTAFAENDRILLKVYITNVGTMGSGQTCTLTYNGADAATGDSFFNIAETVTFKSDAFPQALTATMSTFAATLTKQGQKVLSASMSTFSATIVKRAGKVLDASMSTFGAVLTALHVFTVSFSASMSTFSGSLSRQTSHLMSASMSTFTGQLLKRTAKSFAATMSTFSGDISKRTSKAFAASMSLWAAVISFVGPPPPGSPDTSWTKPTAKDSTRKS